MLRFEQAVYGSFAFRDTGYAPLASSPGCRPEWLNAFHEVCRSLGEKPSSLHDLQGMMFSLRIKPNGPWMVVGVSSQGADDRGRPGALAFHGLFVEAREFRKVGYNPFALSDAIRTDWGPQTTLAADTMDVKKPEPPTGGARALAISSALARRRKVVMESAMPILELARLVWEILPIRVRKRCSVATWAFANDPEFDLVATPKLAVWKLEGPYRDPFGEELPQWKRDWRRVSWIRAATIATIGIAIMTLGVWQLREHSRIPTNRRSGRWFGNPVSRGVSSSIGILPKRVRDPVPGPEKTSYPDDSNDQAAIAEVVAKLVILGRDGLGIRDFNLPGDFGVADLQYVLDEVGSVRYTGPLLNSAELAAIGGETSSGRSRAIAWDSMIHRFVADRWPPEPTSQRAINDGPLRWQIDTLAWSFHLELDSKLTTAEVVDAISDVLKLDEPIQSNPLEEKYHSLGEYAKFLRRLPVR